MVKQRHKGAGDFELTAATETSAPPAARSTPQRLLTALVAVGAVLVLAQRLWLGGSPLWLDETWTGMIAGQDSWLGFWREAWLDCNAPLYYLVMHGWQMMAGQSDWAMRAPSLVFVALAGLAPLFWRPPGLSRTAAMVWAALIWCWWPGFAISIEARAYGLLLLVSVAQTIAYAALLERPDLRRATVWCGLAALSILTHYYAVYLAALQGVLYLFLRRGEAARTWPAALLFAPAFGWLAVHLPRLADYARPDVAWYVPIGVRDFLSSLAYLVGPSSFGFIPALAALLIGGVIVGRRIGPAEPDEPPAPGRHLAWAAATGLITFALLIGLSLIRPLVTERYFTPLVAPVLLGVVLLAGRGRRAHLTYLAVTALFLAAMLTPAAQEKRLERRALYGFAQPSEFLMDARPTTLVFAWDHPAAKILDDRSLAQLGGWFFHRAGMEPATVAVKLAPNEDPNPKLLAAARGDRPAILWIYNKGRKSAARDYPPRIADLAPDWRCMHIEDGPRGVIACAPKRLFG